jgi:3D (Asp-Asp-Asp) domain-containing protein
MIALAASLIVATSTGYSPCSSGTPMANGEHTRWGSVAVNGLRLGTRIRLTRPVHGRRRFTVRDRGGMPSPMAVDIFFPSCGAAVRYGRRTVRYRVLATRRNHGP